MSLHATNAASTTDTKHNTRQAVVAALPIVAGYVVLGIPCGVLGVAAQMDLVQIALMSLLFYSGAGQYMIPNMWLAGSPIASIILSVSLVNTRQLLYAASLSRYLTHASKRLTTLFAATLTDESFGVNLAQFSKGASWTVKQATLVNLCSLTSWIISNCIGAVLGNLLSVPVALASFAMTSIFICLLFVQRFNAPAITAAAFAVVGVGVCKLIGLGGPAILIGALVGIAAGLAMNIMRGSGGQRDARGDDHSNTNSNGYAQ